MTIGNLVKEYPETAEVLQSYGIHCVGCRASPYETIEQGLTGHGLSSEKIDEILGKLNELVDEDLSLTLTENAVKKIKMLVEEEKAKAMRITVELGGCSGNKYLFTLDKEDPKKGDLIIMQGGVAVFCDKKSLSMINGSEIDYKETLQGAGFKISNPKATNTCGCGDSFR